MQHRDARLDPKWAIPNSTLITVPFIMGMNIKHLINIYLEEYDGFLFIVFIYRGVCCFIVVLLIYSST
jgi:hypothetical protein